MPKIRRRNLPPTLLNHLLAGREISADQLGELADWLVTDPEVPDRSVVQTIFENDCVRRRRTGEDVSAIWTGSRWRRGEVRPSPPLNH
jgi:hypothetical protein